MLSHPHRVKCILLFFTLLFTSMNLNAARYEITNDGLGCPSAIWVIGEIRSGDADRLRKLLTEIERHRSEKKCAFPNDVLIDSMGGSVAEAMKMGRAIRERLLNTTVSQPSECFSSCVVLLAAGARRSAFGKIGIHRPYFSEVDNRLSSTDIRIIRQQQNALLRAYFAEMDVSETLLDAMLAVPPSEMRILGEAELLAYRLVGEDSNIEERRIAKQANFYAVTSGEYRKRDAIATQKCTIKGRYEHDCWEAQLLNIGIGELRNRRSRASKKCRIGALEERISCVRSIVVLGQ